jgi:hypothetical protein
MTQLTTLLNGGGKLLLAGSDAIWRNETSSFVTNMLGVSYQSEGDNRTDAVGISGGSFDGMSVDLSGTDSPKHSMNPYQDTVKPYDSNSVGSLELVAESNYNDAYGFKSGTSMATPHVTGVAALVAQVLPYADPSEWKSIVEETTHPLASLASTTTSGGMVDATAAVARAAQIAIPPADGYRFVARDGGIFSFGNAAFKGSAGGNKLNQPIVGMADTPSREGYWLVASDGGIFAFGDAKFYGSTGSMRLNQPVVTIAPAPSGNGYWLIARDGGVFAFNVPFWGSIPMLRLRSYGGTVQAAATATGNGYYVLSADGGIYTFGDARFWGAATGSSVASVALMPE